MAFGRSAARLLAAALCSPAPAATAIAEKLKLLEHDLHAAALLLRVLVLPLIEPQPALDVQRAALGAILRDRLALFAPRLDVDKDHFLAALAGLHLELPVDREAELANRSALGRHA